MEIGRVVAGKFHIESKLGEGGFGAVYAARQIGLDRRVALKLLHVDALLREETRGRFRREARLAQTLTHPNIVRLYDYGETEEGIPFIAWEMLAGRSLDALLGSEGPLPAARVAHFARQALKALMEAHALGIVHRDIKPANLFVCDFAGAPDTIKVLDFGIAAVHSGLASQTLTREGTTVGTPAYMSPEQVMGEALDGRADLYSLGLTLAECLTATPVFRGESAMRIAITQASPAPPPLDPTVLASPLGPVIERATRKDREERFMSAKDMLEAVDRSISATSAWLGVVPPAREMQSSGPLPLLPPPRAIAPPPVGRMGLAWLVLVIMGVAIVAVGLFAGLYLTRSGGHAATSSPATTSQECPSATSSNANGCSFDERRRERVGAVLGGLGYRKTPAPFLPSTLAQFDTQSGDAEELTIVMGGEAQTTAALDANAAAKNKVTMGNACIQGCAVLFSVHAPALSDDARSKRANAVKHALESL